MQRQKGPVENVSQSFPSLCGQVLDRCDRFSWVLDGRNQEVLDRLFNQPSPASTFEAVSVGSVSKTTFHQMLPAFAIKLGSPGIGLSTRSIQECLIAMTFKAAVRFGSGTELPQSATQTVGEIAKVEDAVIVSHEAGPIYGRDAIEKHFVDIFKNLHFSKHMSAA